MTTPHLNSLYARFNELVRDSRIVDSGIFDLCVMNLDRNDGNLLVTPYIRRSAARRWMPPHRRTPQVEAEQRRLEEEIRQEEEDMIGPNGSVAAMKLYPIDHGLTFPDSLDVTSLDWVWFHWPQAKLPFGPKELKLITSMNPDRDVNILSKHFDLRPSCFRTYRVCCRLVKRGAVMHLNLHQLASIAAKPSEDQPSILELLITESLRRAHATMTGASFGRAPLMTTSALDLATVTVNRPDRFVTKVSFAESEFSDSESASRSQSGGAYRTSNEESVAADELRLPSVAASHDIVFKHTSDSRPSGKNSVSDESKWHPSVPPSVLMSKNFPVLQRTQTIGQELCHDPEPAPPPILEENERAKKFLFDDNMPNLSSRLDGLKSRIQSGQVQLSKLTGLPISGNFSHEDFAELVGSKQPPGEWPTPNGTRKGIPGRGVLSPALLHSGSSLLQQNSFRSSRRQKFSLMMNIKEDSQRSDSVWNVTDPDGKQIRLDWNEHFERWENISCRFLTRSQHFLRHHRPRHHALHPH